MDITAMRTIKQLDNRIEMYVKTIKELENKIKMYESIVEMSRKQVFVPEPKTWDDLIAIKDELHEELHLLDKYEKCDTCNGSGSTDEHGIKECYNCESKGFV